MTPATTRVRKHYLGPAGLPKCGRHLSRPEQPPDSTVLCGNHSTMQVTADVAEVTCRHCLRELKRLPPVSRQQAESEEESEEDMLYRELTEEEDAS